MPDPMITRMSCQLCHKRHGTAFSVPTEMWQMVMLEKYWWGEVCLDCFSQEADEKLVRWCEVITIYPLSLVVHLERAGVT
jgi:hypothetical protein